AVIAPLRRLAWSTWRPIAERAARAYVAGPELAHALQVCRALARQGMATTICPWDAESDNPRQVADWYLAALDGLAGAGLDSDLEIRERFLAIVRALAGRARCVVVATHDPALARPALECLRAAGTVCELELLFGLPVRSLLPVARAAGVPVRFYVPYGHAWLPYCLSQARQHPRILWWTMRDWLLGWHRPDGMQYPGLLPRG